LAIHVLTENIFLEKNTIKTIYLITGDDISIFTQGAPKYQSVKPISINKDAAIASHGVL